MGGDVGDRGVGEGAPQALAVTLTGAGGGGATKCDSCGRSQVRAMSVPLTDEIK